MVTSLHFAHRGERTSYLVALLLYLPYLLIVQYLQSTVILHFQLENAINLIVEARYDGVSSIGKRIEETEGLMRELYH